MLFRSFKLFIDEIETGKPNIKSYSGYVSGRADSSVVLTIVNGRIKGTASIDGEKYSLDTSENGINTVLEPQINAAEADPWPMGCGGDLSNDIKLNILDSSSGVYYQGNCQKIFVKPGNATESPYPIYNAVQYGDAETKCIVQNTNLEESPYPIIVPYNTFNLSSPKKALSLFDCSGGGCLKNSIQKCRILNIKDNSNQTSEIGLVARWQGPGDANMYLGKIVYGPNTQKVSGVPRTVSLEIWKNVSNNWTKLSSSIVSHSDVDFSKNDDQKNDFIFSVVDNKLSLTYSNFTINCIDNDLKSEGRIGFRIIGNNSLPTSSISDATKISNYYACTPKSSKTGECCDYWARVYSIAFIGDKYFYQWQNSNEDQCLAYISVLLQGLNQIYEPQIGTKFQISQIRLFKSDSIYDKASCVGGNGCLSVIPKLATITHWLSGRSGAFSSNTQTIDAIGRGTVLQPGQTICDGMVSGSETSYFQTVGWGNLLSWSTTLLAHEIGHNLGATHTSSGVMCAPDGGCSYTKPNNSKLFLGNSINQIAYGSDGGTNCTVYIGDDSYSGFIPTLTPTPTLTATNTPTPTRTPTLTLSSRKIIAPTKTLTSTPTLSLTPTNTPTLTKSLFKRLDLNGAKSVAIDSNNKKLYVSVENQIKIIDTNIYTNIGDINFINSNIQKIVCGTSVVYGADALNNQVIQIINSNQSQIKLGGFPADMVLSPNSNRINVLVSDYKQNSIAMIENGIITRSGMINKRNSEKIIAMRINFNNNKAYVLDSINELIDVINLKNIGYESTIKLKQGCSPSYMDIDLSTNILYVSTLGGEKQIIKIDTKNNKILSDPIIVPRNNNQEQMNITNFFIDPSKNIYATDGYKANNLLIINLKNKQFSNSFLLSGACTSVLFDKTTNKVYATTGLSGVDIVG